jgi:uncharacterized delta-60 repeat protein
MSTLIANLQAIKTSNNYSSIDYWRTIVKLAITLLVFPAFNFPDAIASPGDLDSSFNGTGIVLPAPGVRSGPSTDVLITSDGKPVVLTTYAIYRYLPNGLPDSGFGANGRLDSPIGIPTAIALQLDGKILVAARAGGNAALIRFFDNGSLDTSFGTGGISTIYVGTTYNRINAVNILPDGRIVTAGVRQFGSGSKPILTRHLGNGAPDTTFGTNGIVIPDSCRANISSSGFEKMLILPNSMIIALDQASQCIFGFNNNGSIAQAFGSNGVVFPDIGAIDIAYSLSEKILVGGFMSLDLALQQLFTDGTVDTNFGINGVSRTIFERRSYIYALTTTTDGRIFSTGTNYTEPGGRPRLIVASHLPNGALDPSFGSGGIVVPYEDTANNGDAITIQADNKILVTGYNMQRNNPLGEFILIRLLVNPNIPANIPTLSWHALALLTLSLGLLGVVYRKRKSS